MGNWQFKTSTPAPQPAEEKPKPSPPKEDPVKKAADALKEETLKKEKKEAEDKKRAEEQRKKDAAKPLVYENKPLPERRVPPAAEEVVVIDRPTTETVGKQILDGFDNIFGMYNSKMPVFEGLASMDNEKQLLTDLNDFNIKYAKYISCNDNKTCAVSNAQLVADINAAADRLTTDISTLRSSTASEPRVTPQDYRNRYSALNTGYDSILKTRGELDMKLKELYQTEDSNLNSYKKNFDSTLYSEILLLTLATSIIYYIFTKV